jgi:hypothetical protein
MPSRNLCPVPADTSPPVIDIGSLTALFPSVLVLLILDYVPHQVHVDETNVWLQYLYILRTSTKIAKWLLIHKVPDGNRFVQNRTCLFCGNRLGEIKFALCGNCRKNPNNMELYVITNRVLQPRCPVSSCRERPSTPDALSCRYHMPKKTSPPDALSCRYHIPINTPPPKSDAKESKQISDAIKMLNGMLHRIATNRYHNKGFFVSVLHIKSVNNRVFCCMKGCRNQLSPRSKIIVCKNCVSRFTVHLHKNKNHENLPLIKSIPEKTKPQVEFLFPKIDVMTCSIVFPCMKNGCCYGTTSISDSICPQCATS